MVSNKITVGLYNECKCKFWTSLCEDIEVGAVACDYAVEYCCGDYLHFVTGDFLYLNSPTCFCDFFDYAQSNFQHTLKPKAINTTNEFSNPCSQSVEIGSGWIPVKSREIESLKTIFEETNGENWRNHAGWMDETVDFCQWYGVSCNEKGFIIGIDLRDNNLKGPFPLYTRSINNHSQEDSIQGFWLDTKNGLANLFYLETLDLADNLLTGTIDYRPLFNLKSLYRFDISGNYFTGEVEALITPSVSYANFSNNHFTSMHSFAPFKISPLQTLRSLDVSNNGIQIDTDVFSNNIPPNIEKIIASNNAIKGSLPAALNNLPMLRRFDMSLNALSGQLPVFTESNFILRELNLSNQAIGFTGSIPEELWRLQFLKILNLAGNKLTGTIPPDIVNMAVLGWLDLSNNFLSGQIPSQFSQLDGE